MIQYCITSPNDQIDTALYKKKTAMQCFHWGACPALSTHSYVHLHSSFSWNQFLTCNQLHLHISRQTIVVLFNVSSAWGFWRNQILMCSLRGTRNNRALSFKSIVIETSLGHRPSLAAWLAASERGRRNIKNVYKGKVGVQANRHIISFHPP